MPHVPTCMSHAATMHVPCSHMYMYMHVRGAFPFSLFTSSDGVNRGMVPPLPLVPRPPHSARTSMEGRDNPEPGYESAGLGGVANNLHEPQSSNVYAEINPRPDPNRARGSVERGQVSRPHCECHVTWVT